MPLKSIDKLKKKQSQIATSREYCAEEDLILWDTVQKEIEFQSKLKTMIFEAYVSGYYACEMFSSAGRKLTAKEINEKFDVFFETFFEKNS